MTSSTKSLRESWSIQRRVIGALFLRESLTRFGRHNLGFLWLFVEPMLFTLGVAALWSILRAVHSSDLPIIAFAVTGYSSVLLWRNMPSRAINSVTPNHSLMYHRNVKVIDIFLSRLLLEGAGATMSFVILSLIFIFIGGMKPPEDVLKVALAWFLLAWFGTSLAVFLAALNERSELVEKIWMPANYLLFPLSGAAFLVDPFPKAFQDWILLVPMVNGTEMLRDGYFGSAIRTHYSASYLALWCLGLTLFGLVQTRIVSRRVTPE